MLVVPNSRYKDGTPKSVTSCPQWFHTGALRSDRCLVLTTCFSISAPFHGGNRFKNSRANAKSWGVGSSHRVQASLSKGDGSPKEVHGQSGCAPFRKKRD